MQEYIITIKDKIKILAGYDRNLLVKAEILNILNVEKTEQQEWLWRFIPRNLTKLSTYKNNPDISYKSVELDLSFQRFWNDYQNKKGNKARAEKLWLGLSKEDRIKALDGIKKYNYFLATQTAMNKAFPETYLSQRRYENEY
ncbi:MAG: hypothetical protein AAF242_00190 [Bacteroidota bacterium]